MKPILGLGMMLAADSGRPQHEKARKEIVKSLKEKPIPKGRKKYHFNSEGEFRTDKMLRTEVVFKCIASNDKNAIRKFKNHKLAT